MATYRVTGGTLEVEPVGGEGQPPSIWPSPEHPAHPIVIPIPPGGIDPGPPPIPAHPIYLPVYPAHPIVIPPNAIGPGHPEHPIVLPPYYPAHPIVIPPGIIDPGPPPIPAHPIVLPPPPGIIWPGRPEHPIVLPPEPPVGGGDEGRWVYSPVYGWVWDPGPGGKPQPLP